MKKLLLMLCLTTTAAFAEERTKDAEMTSPTDCTVTFKPVGCYIRKAVECYQAKCSIESGSYTVSLIPWLYGGTTPGYTIHYSKDGGDGVQIMGRSYETKGEAISAWLKRVYGEGCSYSYK